MKLRDSLATDIKPGYAFMLNREKQAFWVQDFVVKAHDQDPQDPDEWVLLGSQRRGIRCRVGRVGSASARDASEVEWTAQTEIFDIDAELFVKNYCGVLPSGGPSPTATGAGSPFQVGSRLLLGGSSWWIARSRKVICLA